MSLNDIPLTPALLASLYPASIVLTEGSVTQAPPPFDEKPTEMQQPPASREVKFLGSNQQHVLILVNYPETVHLPDETLAFLTNILTACKLGLGDVAIMNRHLYRDTGYKELLTYFKSRVVLMFNIEPAAIDLPVSFPEFQVQLLAGTTFLYAPSLEECRDDKLVKSKLWISLQHVFSIK